jgi:hypothetical protein
MRWAAGLHSLYVAKTLMTYSPTSEEELKNRIRETYFAGFDCTRTIGNIDFCVALRTKNEDQQDIYGIRSFLWAEAKRGNKANIIKSFVQLILTIGKARTFDKHLPPSFLGAFDAGRIAFLPYNEIQSVFYKTDFNWNVAPSNHETKEFKELLALVAPVVERHTFAFDWRDKNKELAAFIKENFLEGKVGVAKIQVNKNNFVSVYNKWRVEAMPTIGVNWEVAKKAGLIDGDFYLADLLSSNGKTIRENLYVILKEDRYLLDRVLDASELFRFAEAGFTDGQKAYMQFWNKYERPPKEEYHNYIVERRDLLVPQDVRERKGSFFTPQIWVELSQRYLTDVLGEDWQDEYYIWDCAAGTGNLLAGLTNKYNIWASTLDRQDVDVMKDRIDNGANLLKEHVFQFDFLNGDFNDLPQSLKTIIDSPEKRKKLIIYINPPYAEASNKKTLERGKEGNKGVEQSAINKKYAGFLGQGNAELFAQFLTRIYFEIDGAVIAEFSTLKILTGQHFVDFRKFFFAKIRKSFVVPADTFDNVKGQFPIGFMIWDTSQKEPFQEMIVDVYNKRGELVGEKCYCAYDNSQYMNDWVKPFRARKSDSNIIGKFPFKGNDFQNQNMVQIVHPEMEYNTEAGQFLINHNNVLVAGVYFAVRKSIDATWLNDRDQFLFPNEGWAKDAEFQSDCLAYTLFNNNIQSRYGANHWIPFRAQDVNARAQFQSDFMYRFLAGKLPPSESSELFESTNHVPTAPVQFSPEAKVVFETGKALWQYYHAQPASNPDASLYDIKAHFQGRNEQGRMNAKSNDEQYNVLLAALRDALKSLARKIEPKIYEYGFLK